MNSSNSFNICPRCGNSNSLNAKYCSRCGAQLKVPEEAVVCYKCHTRNSSLANFCRNCGTTLKVGAQTKICPRCGKEINADDNVCACGYSFVTLQQTEPKQVSVASTNKSKKDKKRDKKQELAQTEQNKSTKIYYSKKGGRGFAIFALLLLAVFAYIIIAPATARPAFLVNFDKGFYNRPADYNPKQDEEETGSENAWINNAPVLNAEGDGTTGDGETTTNPGDTTPPTENDGENTTPPPTESNSGETLHFYGLSCITEIINFAKDIKDGKVDLGGGEAFTVILERFGKASFVMIALVALFVITAVFHFVVCIMRIITKRRSKGMNLLYLILAIVTTILVAIMVCSQLLTQTEGFLFDVKEFFAPMGDVTGTCKYGWALFFIPAYYWVFWLYSCIAKAKKMKEKTA